ncbi:MAG TPA: hypothetical protein VFR24_17365 [Candidatus Angelobacter sp.]|nr:hypothetical protein [Candidatus Angelobacter sp.]
MHSKLIALKIRRRVVAAAVFSGRTLEHIEALQLCNEPEAVNDAVARFLANLLERFHPDSAAIGISRGRIGQRVVTLTETAEAMLRADAIPFWRIEDRVVLETYAVPGLNGRLYLRPIVRSFWPHLAEKQLTGYEAAALGLHVQVERLLSHY